MHIQGKHWKIFAVALLFASPGAFAQTEQDTNTAVNQLRMGDAAFSAHNYQYALRAYTNADRMSQGACIRCSLKIAQAYAALKNWPQAILVADHALSIATTNTEKAQAHNSKGTAYLGQISEDPKNIELAQQEYRGAVQLDPRVPVYHLSLGIALLKGSRDEEGVKELQRFVDIAPDDTRVSMAKQWIAEPRRARGNFAPEFHVTSTQGDEISLDTLKGKIAVLDFWATWCPPCREALPDLKALLPKYNSNEFVLVSVSLDEDKSAWQEFVAKEKMTWPQVSDANRDLFNKFGLSDVPTYIVLGADGSIIERVVGTDPQHSVAYRLKDILARQPALNPH